MKFHSGGVDFKYHSKSALFQIYAATLIVGGYTFHTLQLFDKPPFQVFPDAIIKNK